MTRKSPSQDPPPNPTHVGLDGGIDDALLEKLLEKVTALARAAGESAVDDIDDLVADYVQGYAHLAYEQKRILVRELLADAAAQSAAAPEEAAALQAFADRLEAQALDVDATAKEADELIQDQAVELAAALKKYNKLGLLMRNNARFAFITAPATAFGLGVLVKLALAAVDDQLASWSLTVAAVLGALGAEAVIGLLCAALYKKLPNSRRPRALLLALVVVLLMTLTTEGFAVYARQQGVAATNAGPQINPTTGVITASDSKTPSLIWTGPLSILLTLAGAGALGARSLTESAKPQRERIKQAKKEIDKGWERKRQISEQAAQLRERANELRVQASQRKAAGTASAAAGPLLIEKLDAERAKHDQIAKVAAAEGMLTYYIARNTPPQQPPRSSGHNSTPELVTGGIGAAVLAGAVTALLGAGLPLMAGVGGAVLLASMIVGTLVRNAQRAAMKGAIS